MDISGVIVEVLESWPLQIAVVAADERRVLPLDADAAIVRGDARLSPGDLRPGQQGRFEIVEEGGGVRIVRVVLAAQ